jgi:riboflavin kinase/FMN adenylyltransferase
MKVHTDIEHLPEFKNAVVTIGTFDGVHLGHQKIITQLKSEADKISGETVIITFHPHPRKILNGTGQKIKLITTIEERIELLSAKGVDHLVVVPFTQDFSEMAPRDYIEHFLNYKFNPAVVIIGYDHKFGRERKGDYKLLEEYSANGYFDLNEIPEHVINDSTVSSTIIRNSLKEGDVDNANRLLGYDFYFEGTIVKGDQRGRKIGFSTANLALNNEDKILPGNGVYAVEAAILNKQDIGKPNVKSDFNYKGMMNIGMRPTVDGSTKTIEVHLFDFSEDIYGKILKVRVKAFLRPEIKFKGIEELKQQLEKDKINAQKKLGK